MVKVPYLFLKGYHVDKSASLRKRKYGSSKEEQDQKKNESEGYEARLIYFTTRLFFFSQLETISSFSIAVKDRSMLKDIFGPLYLATFCKYQG